MMENNNIKKRLFDYESAPPAGMWDRIAEKLDVGDTSIKEAPVVLFSDKKKNNWMKIALAASFLGFVTMSALWFFNKNAKKNSKEINTVNTSVTPTIIRDTVYIPGSESNNTITAPDNKNLATQPDIIIPGQDGDPNKTNPAPKDIPGPQVQKSLEKIEAPVLVNTNKLKDVIIKDDNGNPVRNIELYKATDNNNVSGPDSKGDKAIANILSKISTASDKEEIDSIINNSNYWKNQIQSWRNELIKSGYNPSVINLLDLAELIRLLEKK